jgi:hypothetical protein
MIHQLRFHIQFLITSAYDNNTPRMSFPSGSGAATFTDYDIPAGFFTIEDLTSC